MDKVEKTLHDIVKLLEEHKWLHQYRVTDFFKEEIYNKIPFKWKDVLCNLSLHELNNLPMGLYKEEWPNSLLSFIMKCSDITSQRLHMEEEIIVEKECDLKIYPGLTLKKLHEVKSVVKLIGEVCQNSDCQNVIDVGSGVGHLDFYLAKHLPIKVLGLEQDHAMVNKANANASDSMSPKVKSVQLKLGDESMQELEGIIQSEFHGNPSLLTGLHCCGDLSINVINSFIHLPSIHHLVLLSCCYHSMKHGDDITLTFKNFPLSKMLTKILNESNMNRHLSANDIQSHDHPHLPTKHPKPSDEPSSTHTCSYTPLINVSSLRLACQQSRSSWVHQTAEEHQEHSLNVAYRGLLQQALSINEIPFVKYKKKLSKIRVDTSFKQYLAHLVDRSSINENQAKMIESHYEENKDFLKYIEPFTALQVMLQSLIEHLILLDRMLYVRDHGHECFLLNIFHDEISPRNCAIIAHKKIVDL